LARWLVSLHPYFFIQNEFQKLNQDLLESSNFYKFGSHQ
jgi:hypothetical protein